MDILSDRVLPMEDKMKKYIRINLDKEAIIMEITSEIALLLWAITSNPLEGRIDFLDNKEAERLLK